MHEKYKRMHTHEKYLPLNDQYANKQEAENTWDNKSNGIMHRKNAEKANHCRYFNQFCLCRHDTTIWHICIIMHELTITCNCILRSINSDCSCVSWHAVQRANGQWWQQSVLGGHRVERDTYEHQLCLVYKTRIWELLLIIQGICYI